MTVSTISCVHKKTRIWQGMSVAALLFGLLVMPMCNALADDERKALSPTDSVLGMSQGDWGAAWWQWILSIPASDSPLLDENGNRCSEGQGDSAVFFLAGTWTGGPVQRECTIPSGKFLFFPIINAECSTVEVGTQWYGANEAELRQCAGRSANDFDGDSLVVTVDGKQLKKLDQQRVVSAAYRFILPENDILGLGPDEALSVSDGYYVMLQPLPLGEHSIHFGGGADWNPVVTYTINVE